MAIKGYERVPASSPLKRNAQIQLASDLDAADCSDEAIAILKGVIAEDPKDLEAIMALGNVERNRKKFADCTDTYSKGIGVLPDPNDKANTVYYYYRGICEERSHQWSKAEVDMKQGAQAAARSAPRAKLSRLFLDRPGHQSRRRHEDDQARRRSAP